MGLFDAIIKTGLDVVSNTAKTKIQNLTSSEGVAKALTKVATSALAKRKAGVPAAQAEQQAIDEVASLTADQIINAAQEDKKSAGIPTWLILAGAGAVVVVGGTIVYFVTKRRQ